MACEPQELVTAAGCFICKTPKLDSIEILLLCIVAGGAAPSGIILGNPDEDWGFGDPGGGFVFGDPTA